MAAFSRLLICFLIAPAIAGPTFLHYNCSDKQGTYTSGSSYNTNLNLILLADSTRIDTGFYNSTYGENPDKVSAIGLCRGDLKPDDCRNCLGISKDNLTVARCPNQKEGIVWYDECMFRYSNRTIFSTMEETPEFPWMNILNAFSGDEKFEFNNTLWNFLQNLSDRAAAGDSLGRKFAVGNETAGPNFPTIYGLVQCTPDLSQQDCSHCLSGAIDNYWNFYGGETGGRNLMPSCNFRYEIYRFYDTTADAPPPSPGKESDKSRTAIIIVVAAVVALVIIISIYIYLRVRKNQSISTTGSTLSFEFSWDVFLNFRGSDTRKNFVDHLYNALVEARIKTFRDDEGIQRGEVISTELSKAIEKSRIYIVVFSEDYASSCWCLNELVEIVGHMKFRGQTLLPIFYHVIPSDVKEHTGTFAEAFATYEDRFRTDIGMVFKWKDALTEAAKCAGFNVDSFENGHEAKLIKAIVEDVILKLNATGRTRSKSRIASSV